MYNNVLPNTGVTATTIVGLGMTANQMVSTGICIFIVGLILFKLLRFKAKDAKN